MNPAELGNRRLCRLLHTRTIILSYRNRSCAGPHRRIRLVASAQSNSGRGNAGRVLVRNAPLEALSFGLRATSALTRLRAPERRRNRQTTFALPLLRGADVDAKVSLISGAA